MASASQASQPQGTAANACDLPGLTQTPWGTADLAPRYSQLSEDTEADICVVGGGIVGLSVAYNLQKSGERLYSAAPVHFRSPLTSEPYDGWQ